MAEALEVAISKLKRSKRLIVRQLNSIKSSVAQEIEENPSADVVNQLQSNLDLWKEKLAEIQTIDEELLEYIDYKKPIAETTKLEEEIIAEFCAFEKDLVHYRGKVKTIHDVVHESKEKPRSSFLNASFLEASLTSPTVKIQDIPVPKFDGLIQNFPDWYDEFESMIDKNEGLDNFQKLYLLKRAMIGDAEKILKNWGSKPDLYPLALEHLRKIFYNKRRIIAGYFGELLDLPFFKNAILRESIENVQRIVRGLTVCGIDTSKMSPLITFIISRKLPDKLRIDWENSNRDYSTYPSFEPMATFLTDRCFAYETTKLTKKEDPPPYKPPPKGSLMGAKDPEQDEQSKGKNLLKCVVCGEAHYLNQCKRFTEKSVNERFNIVKKNKLCIKCFNPYHTLAKCKRFNCSKCNENHHVMLHRETSDTSGKSLEQKETLPKETPASTSSDTSKFNGVFCGNSTLKKTTVLSTAVVKVVNNNRIELARVLLDGGSEVSLVSKEFCNRARLNMYDSNEQYTLTGINGSSVLDKSVKILLKSRFSNFQLAIEANVIGKVPYQVNQRVITDVTKYFTDMNFGESNDLTYNNVDILIGCEYAEFIFEDQRKFFEDICLRNSKFGYVISGSQKSSFLIEKKELYCGLTNIELSEQFKRFCRIENVTDKVELDNENKVEHELIIKHFDDTYQRDETGRFILRLPTKSSIDNLKGSFYKTKSLFLRNERKLSETCQKAYATFMTEYENLGHMSKLSSVKDLVDIDTYYFIPHHLVTKLSGEIIKHRVVFNASFKDESGTSANDHLLDGPVVQPELFTNVICFRVPIIVVTADIANMYRQILIHKDDRKYQIILYRLSKFLELMAYVLNTLTQGFKPASFMATYCLKKVADSILETHPRASESIAKRFYMDNWNEGGNSVEEVICTQRIVHDALEAFGFPLRKYMSNSSEVLAKIDPTFIEPLKSRIIGGDSFTYLLGLVWYPEPDTLRVMINVIDLPNVITKRVVLSHISKIFDILGMISPVTIKGKMIMQDIWRLSIAWDESLSPDVEKEYLLYRENLLELCNFSIPRCLYSSKNVVQSQLIGFSDASIRAYSAVIYVRSVDSEGNVNLAFLCAKTRVAPLSAINIHRLELLGALLLSRLLDRTCTDMNFNRANVYAFSDSQVTLSWINHSVEQLKQYVSNRVVKITSIIPKSRWFYVDTKSNPADLATRGISAKVFLSNKLWICGPEWCHENFDSSISLNFVPCAKIPELLNNKMNFNVIQCEMVISILKKYSSLTKCVNVLAWMFRWKSKIKCNVNDNVNTSPPLTIDERNFAFKKLIHFAQLEHFSNEYFRLLNNDEISKESKLLSLNVILTADNLLRVGGRLSASNFSFDTKYPIILDKKSRLVELYILFVHERYFHASKSFILNFIRSKFRVIGGLTSLIKKIVNNCVLCTRFNAKFVEQFMADLPKERSLVSRPFSTTGVDFSGAFTVKCVNHRSIKHNKVYISFFVCFSTRAVHLELVEDLSTEAFLAAFERFISRRGVPNTMYSDNGTNFVGTFNVIEKSKIINFSTSNSINWRFISPRSPHQGGLWEAAVKAGKICLAKAIGTQILNFNEFNTLIIKVEAILNSRPIAYRNVTDFVEPLTPAHFLIGSSFFDSPISDDNSIKLKARFRLWRSIVDSFWVSWRHDYLNQLQSRSKWKEKRPNLSIGDVVLFSKIDAPAMSWPLGRIVAVYPDKSGIVRNVDVITSDGTFRRAVQKLVRLPIEN